MIELLEIMEKLVKIESNINLLLKLLENDK